MTTIATDLGSPCPESESTAQMLISHFPVTESAFHWHVSAAVIEDLEAVPY